MSSNSFLNLRKSIERFKDNIFYQEKTFQNLIDHIDRILIPDDVQYIGLKITDPFLNTAFIVSCLMQGKSVVNFESKDFDKHHQTFINNKIIDLIINEQNITHFVKKYTTTHDEVLFNESELMIPTSGSTGKSKIVSLSCSNLYYSALGTIEFYDINAKDSWWLNLPLNHIGGIMIIIRSIYSGCSISKDIENANFVSLVPTQLYRFFKDTFLISKLRDFKGIIVGGAEAPLALKKLISINKLPVSLSYGMSECCSQLAATRPGEVNITTNDSGVVLNYREFKLSSTSEIQIKGQTLFRGYYSDNKFTPTALDEGYFTTNDLGKIENKKLIHKGRKALIVKSGGENINVQEVENKIKEIESILDCRIIPIKDIEFGEVLSCFLESDETIDITKLKEIIKTNLLRHEYPKCFFMLNEVKISSIKRSRLDFEIFLKKQGFEI